MIHGSGRVGSQNLEPRATLSALRLMLDLGCMADVLAPPNSRRQATGALSTTADQFTAIAARFPGQLVPKPLTVCLNPNLCVNPCPDPSPNLNPNQF